MNDLWKFDGNYWTWMSGSKERNDGGDYGIQGEPSASNLPPSRHSALGWTDLYGNFWLFGGAGSVITGKTKDYSDDKFI
jgi:hypothetical protein